MKQERNLAELVFDDSLSFSERCLEIFQFQVRNNPVYQRFSSVFGLNEKNRPDINAIPLLPVRAFKQSRLLCEGFQHELIFRSSGTGKMERSIHYIADPGVYRKSIRFEFYSHFPENEYSILSYTPGYSENPDSSLLWMVEDLLKNDASHLSKRLPLGNPLPKEQLNSIIQNKKKILLFGAAFGLLDLLDMNSDPLPEGSEIIETGGMKTHRRQLSKKELRQKLSEGFGVPLQSVHSEYGMCELLSQFYAVGSEWFSAPHWTNVTIRRADDPSELCKPGEEGKIGIIDLANLYSCPFLLTEDRGVSDSRGRFRVLGRWNSEDLRGCNFLIDRE